jgi:hypothetical protein
MDLKDVADPACITPSAELWSPGSLAAPQKDAATPILQKCLKLTELPMRKSCNRDSSKVLDVPLIDVWLPDAAISGPRSDSELAKVANENILKVFESFTEFLTLVAEARPR